MKWVSDVHYPERITSTTIVYIPFLDGYWKESLDVLKLCLGSMRQNTQLPFDLMVFDNGSCEEVQDYLLDLRRRGEIQYLVLSEHNVGKVGAWNILFLAAPGEIIAYCDSDVYFLPGWLEASLEILEEFPEAGIVTAQPIAGGDVSSLWTTQAAQKNPSVLIQTGCLIPEEYLVAHLAGVGDPEKEYERRQINRKDVLLSRGVTQAYATASHFQFTTTKRVVQALFPSDTTIPLGDDHQFDKEMRDLGYWRLATTQYLVHHMGNRVPDLRSELGGISMGIKFSRSGASNSPVPESSKIRFLHSSFVRRILKRVNTISYKLLYK
ncbi:MAG: glycosyltransferase family 2 protein [Chloroflexota bacterium]